MGSMLQMGQTVPSVGIRRADVAVGYTTYVVPISGQVLSKNVAYVPDFRGYVELSQQEAVESGLFSKVFTAYFMLVAHLETGIRGEIVSDKITVEYLRFTQNQYEKFLVARQANPNANSIMLTKDKRTNSEGKDVSSLSMLPAVCQFGEGVAQRIQQLTAKPETVQGLWSMVDAATGVPYAQYKQQVAQAAGVGGQQLPGRDPQAGQLPPMPTQAPAGYGQPAGGYGAAPAVHGGYGAAPQPAVQAPAPAPVGYGTAAAPQPSVAPQPFEQTSTFGGDPLSFEGDLSGFDGDGNF